MRWKDNTQNGRNYLQMMQLNVKQYKMKQKYVSTGREDLYKSN